MLCSLFHNFFSWVLQHIGKPSAFLVFSKSLECHLGACILELINVWWTVDKPFFPINFWILLTILAFQSRGKTRGSFGKFVSTFSRRWRWAASWLRECGKMDMDDVMQLRSMRRAIECSIKSSLNHSPHWIVWQCLAFAYLKRTYWCDLGCWREDVEQKSNNAEYASPGICQRGGASNCCCGGIARSSEVYSPLQ